MAHRDTKVTTSILGDHKPEPLTYDERERLAKEWTERMVAGFTPGQRQSVRTLLLRKNRPKQDRRRRWTRNTYEVMLIHYALYQEYRGRTEAITKLSWLYRVGADEIEERIRLARKQVPSTDLPDWARWVLTPRAKPPASN